MQGMKKTAETIKNIWKNKRYRSIVVLLGYLVFLVVVVVVFQGLQSPKEVIKPSTQTPLEIFTKVQQYEFVLLEKQQLIFQGKVKENKAIVENSIDYYYQSERLLYQKKYDQYEKIEHPTDIALFLALTTPFEINQLISKGTLEYKTEYSDRTVIDYKVPLSDVSFSLPTWIEFHIQTVEKDSKISQIIYQIADGEEIKNFEIHFQKMGEPIMVPFPNVN